MDAFQTLADPTRRQIVETLRAGELQVGDIVDRLAIHQSGVSRHLHILLGQRPFRARFDRVYLLTLDRGEHLSHHSFESRVDGTYHLGPWDLDEKRRAERACCWATCPRSQPRISVA